MNILSRSDSNIFGANGAESKSVGKARTMHWLIAAALPVLGMDSAFAICSIYTGDGPWNRPTNVALSGIVNVPASSANGTVLATFTAASIPGDLKTIECASNQSDTTRRDFYSLPRAPSSYAPDVYETGVPGVGVKITSGSGGAIPSQSTTVISPTGIAFYSVSPQYILTFIKTGPIGSGTVLSTDIPLANYNLGGRAVIYYLTASGSVTFQVPSCQVSVPNVPLGTHSTSEFSPNPYTANKNFTISLTNCPQTSQIRYQFDELTGYANQAQSIVNVTGGASGVGVQLLNADGSAPSPMGSPQLIGSGSLNYTLPFKARYFKTGSTITPGIANSAMAFTLTYQ